MINVFYRNFSTFEPLSDSWEPWSTSVYTSEQNATGCICIDIVQVRGRISATSCPIDLFQQYLLYESSRIHWCNAPRYIYNISTRGMSRLHASSRPLIKYLSVAVGLGDDRFRSGVSHTCGSGQCGTWIARFWLNLRLIDVWCRRILLKNLGMHCCYPGLQKLANVFVLFLPFSSRIVSKTCAPPLQPYYKMQIWNINTDPFNCIVFSWTCNPPMNSWILARTPWTCSAEL